MKYSCNPAENDYCLPKYFDMIDINDFSVFQLINIGSNYQYGSEDHADYLYVVSKEYPNNANNDTLIEPSDRAKVKKISLVHFSIDTIDDICTVTSKMNCRLLYSKSRQFILLGTVVALQKL